MDDDGDDVCFPDFCCFPSHRAAPAVMCLTRWWRLTGDQRDEVERWLQAEIGEPYAHAVWVDAAAEGSVVTAAPCVGRQQWVFDGQLDWVFIRQRFPVSTPPPWLHPDWTDPQ